MRIILDFSLGLLPAGTGRQKRVIEKNGVRKWRPRFPTGTGNNPTFLLSKLSQQHYLFNLLFIYDNIKYAENKDG